MIFDEKQTKKMMQQDIRKASVYNKFEENMNNALFLSNYESILEIDQVNNFICINSYKIKN